MSSKVLLIAVLLFGGVAHASGYQVSNYVGTIGGYPVHISIQSLEKVGGYGRGIQYFGSYYYDRHRIPIPLYGRMEGGALRLCEELNQKKFTQEVLDGNRGVDVSSCPFHLSLDGDGDGDGDGGSGKWESGKSAYMVSMKRVARLDDLEADIVEGKLEIPFWAQLKKHMLIGIYEKTKSCGVRMTRLIAVNKSSGKVDETFEFNDRDCGAGMLMTSIYLNVEDYSEKEFEAARVHHMSGRDGFETIHYIKGK